MSDTPQPNGMIRQPDVPVPEDAPRQGQLYDPSASAAMAWATFDATTEEGFCLLSEMKHGDKKKLGDLVNTVIEIRNVYIQPVTKLDEATGEEVCFPWILFQLADGSYCSCGSNGVYASLVDIVRFRGSKTFDPPVKVKVIRKGLKEPHFTYGLVYLPSVSSAKPTGGKSRA